MEWSAINGRYVLPARRMLLNGRVAQGEELLRQGLDETGDGWVAYHLAEAIVLQSPDDAGRLEEACALYGRALRSLPAEGHRRLAEAALAKAKVMLSLAPKRDDRPKTLLPAAEAPAVKIPREPEEPVEEEEPPPPDPLVEKLKSLFGFESFLPGQREVIEALMKGRHALAVMPAGSGRSLLYEFPARVLDGATVVVSPHEVRAEKVVRVGPEQLADERLLEGVKVALLVVDEADGASEWGHEFRPEYLRLRDVIRRTRPGAVLAMTAAATPRVRSEIVERLGLASPFVHVGSFDRRNLVWSVIQTKDKAGSLRAVLAEQPGSAIVYTARKADAESVAAMLKTAGVKAAAHEGGTLEEWRADRASVIVAPFGTALEKADVRAVVHWQMPSSIEAYYLEAGRAGRDGRPAQCVLLFDPEDKGFHDWGIDQAYPDREVVLEVLDGVKEGRTREDLAARHGEVRLRAALAELERQGFVRECKALPDAPAVNRLDLADVERRRGESEDRLRAMEAYAESRGCRRLEILRYFGERVPAGWQCAGCDRCRAAREAGGQGVAALRQAVAAGVRELEGRRFSINEMARAILFLAPPHVTRALRGKNEAEVRDLINALLRDGEIVLDPKGSHVRTRR